MLSVVQKKHVSKNSSTLLAGLYFLPEFGSNCSVRQHIVVMQKESSTQKSVILLDDPFQLDKGIKI